MQSLPVQGAWIEIWGFLLAVLVGVYRRSPCRERGLKCICALIVVVVSVSLPVQGAWIEIAIIALLAALVTSLPVRGAWIEIMPT